jgi:phenylalanyl-tRNA synthetase alpha subunit
LKKSLSYTQRIAQYPNVVEQHQKGLVILQAKIINSQQELNKAKAKLEKLQKSDQEAVFGAKVKKLEDRFKSLLTRDEREIMWRNMKCLKEKRNQHRIEIINCRSLISSLKQDLYLKRMAVRVDKAIQEQVKRSGQEKKR